MTTAAWTTFRGEPAVRLRAGATSAVFLPSLGLTGVSLRHRGREHLALPGGLDALRSGGTGGLPLLAPWANRLGARRYRAAGVDVDLAGLRLKRDDQGLPIHGLLCGRSRWEVTALDARAAAAVMRASIDVDHPAFPFPHRLDVTARLGEGALRVDTALTPTGRRRVPVAFGWHPYLRVPGSRRSTWRLELPARTHLELDGRGLPTGTEAAERAEAERIGRRTFDDLYVGPSRGRWALSSDDGRRVELRPGTGYGFAQVWVPPGRRFAALEPMTVPTDALGRGGAPLVSPGETFVASFTLVVAP